jgi:hypothetical protein
VVGLWLVVVGVVVALDVVVVDDAVLSDITETVLSPALVTNISLLPES